MFRNLFKGEDALVCLGFLCLRLNFGGVRLHPTAIVLSWRDGVLEQQCRFTGLGRHDDAMAEPIPTITGGHELPLQYEQRRRCSLHHALASRPAYSYNR